MSEIDNLIAKVCPNGVEFKSLDELGTTYGGLTGKDKADFSHGNTRFVAYTNVYNNLGVDLHAHDFVRVHEGEKQNALQRGDILFTGSSETPEDVGMSSVVLEEPTEPIYLNSFCFGYRLHDPAVLLPGYSKYVFRSDVVRRAIARSASGVTRYNISKGRFLKVRIPVPPIPVQRDIVKVLESFTKLEAELQRELEARRRQYRHYRGDLLSFTDQGDKADVRWMTLGDIGKVSMCKRVLKHETSPAGDIPFYKIGTFGGVPDAFISRELYETYRSRYPFPKKGDILLSAAGTIGRAISYDGEPGYFQDSNIVWIGNDESLVINRYLYYWYHVVEWTTDGGTIQRLYNENIRRARIAVPTLEEQARIVDILAQFDALVNDFSIGLPAELKARRKQFAYYRDRILTFREVA